MARNIDQTTEYMRTTSMPRLPQTTGTLAIWIRPNITWAGSFRFPFHVTDGGAPDNGFTIHQHNSNGLIYAGWAPSSGDKRVTFSQYYLIYQQWNLIVVTWDTGANETKAYVNNVLRATGQATTWDTLGKQMTVGNFPTYSTFGDYSHLSCWNKVLNSTELTSLWNHADPTGISGIVFNYLLSGDSDPEPDTQGGSSLTLTSSPAKSAFDPYDGLPAGYANVKKVTIDHTKVGEDESGFVLPIAGTYAYLKSVANGGEVQSANGYDIQFTSDLAGTNLIPHEEAQYDQSDGSINYYVRTPVSASVDPVIYMWFGNAAVTTSRQDFIRVWGPDCLYSGHMTSPVSQLYDASLSGNDVAAVGAGTAVSGLLGTGANFGGSTGVTAVVAPTRNFPSAGGPVTMIIWFKKPDTTARNGVLISLGKESPAHSLILLYESSGGKVGVSFNGGNMEFAWTADADWHQLAVVQPDSDESHAVVYLDKVSKSLTPATPGTMSLVNANLGISRWPETNSWNFTGILDEARIYKLALTANQITTRFNSESSPATFYSITDISTFNPAWARIRSVIIQPGII